MAVPNKKMYDRKGKLVFDPNNPEDVRRQEELNKQIEMAKQLFSIVDPRGGGGIGAMARGISKAALAKMSKSKFTQNKAKQILELVTKPMTKGKKAASNTRKQAAPTVKEVVEKPVEVIKETLSRLLKPIPKLNKSKSFTTAKAKNALDEVPKDKPSIKTTPTKSDEVIPKINRKKSYSPEKQAKNVSTTTTPKSIRDSWEYNNAGRDYYIDGVEGFRKAGTEAKSIVSRLKDREAAKNAAKKAFEENNPEIIKKSNAQTAMSIAALTSVIGGGAGATYYGMRLSNKDKKQTTTPQKTGPVDLKRINPSKLKPSSIPGVSITKAMVNGKEKEFGIVWDNKTQSWDYYRSDKTKKTPENKQQQEKVRGGGYIPIDNTDKNKGNNQGGGTNTGGGGTKGGTTTKSKTRIEFEKAFAEARKQAGGAGGIFEFNNKKYGTALEGETVPKNRVEVGKTTTPVTIKNEYPTAESDPTLEIAMQQDSIRQQMATKPLPTKPLSELVFKTTAKAAESQKIRNSMDEQNALRSIIADNRIPLKKKRYGGNLAMLKYMKQ